jgi:carboxymethylenebutenolidase
MTEKEIDPRVFDLYDKYCHGGMDRREFLDRAAAITIGGVSALTMAEALLPRYADAEEVSFTDERMCSRQARALFRPCWSSMRIGD